MINFDVCKIRGKLSQVIRKVLSSKNYLGTLVRAIFQLNEWRKFVKLDNVGNILFFFYNKEEEQFWRIVRAFLWGARRLLDSDESLRCW